jgi:hypothetical protein
MAGVEWPTRSSRRSRSAWQSVDHHEGQLIVARGPPECESEHKGINAVLFPKLQVLILVLGGLT